jgi:archaellum component FlaC
MDSDLRTELAELKGMLTGISKGIEAVDDDVKSLSSDVKEIKSDIAGMGKELATLKANTDHNLNEIEKLHKEDKSLWEHFPKHADIIKEFIELKFSEATAQNDEKNANTKNWVLGSALTAAISIIGAAYAVITNLMAGNK